MRQAEFLIEATASQATRLRPYLPYTQAQEDTDWTTRARVTAGAGAMAQRAPLAAVASAAAAESGALSSGIHPHSSASRINERQKASPICRRAFEYARLQFFETFREQINQHINNKQTTTTTTTTSTEATSTPTAGVTA